MCAGRTELCVCDIFVTIVTYVTGHHLYTINISLSHNRLCRMPYSVGPPQGLCPAGPMESASLSSYMLKTQVLKSRGHRPPAPSPSLRLTTPSPLKGSYLLSGLSQI